MSKPTPRPWNRSGHWIVSGAKKVAEVTHWPDWWLANADHIVHCVNQHDALVTACEKAAECPHDVRGWTVGDMREAAELAKAALAETAEVTT